MATASCRRPSSSPAEGYGWSAGTLYGALNALCEKGWISPLPMESGSRKKEYQLTSAGLKVLKQELVRLEELAANGRAILQEEQV